MTHEVFISYSIKDKHIADAVCHGLEENRIKCWISPRDSKPGASYAESIIFAIKCSKIMVLIFSENANLSNHVKRELERAVSKQIIIIPFRIEKVVPSKEIEYYISSTHWLEAITPPIETHILTLVSTIKKILQNTKDLSSKPQVENQLKIFKKTLPRIQIMGIGKAGIEISHKVLDFLSTNRHLDNYNTNFIAIDTYSPYLFKYSDFDQTILLGEKLTKGKGANRDPIIGKNAAMDSIESIKKIINCDLLIAICGLGRGTGTGSTPIILEMVSKQNKSVISICTLPFEEEGEDTNDIARNNIKNFVKSSNTLIIPNKCFMEQLGISSIHELYQMVEKIVIHFIKAINDLIFKPQFINLDFNDVVSTFTGSSRIMIGIGTSDSINDPIEEAFQSAINFPLFHKDKISKFRNGLVYIECDENFTTTNIEEVDQLIKEKISRDIEVVWGFSLNRSKTPFFRVILIFHYQEEYQTDYS